MTGIIHKFGGSSLKDTEKIKSMYKTVTSQNSNSSHFVVVSAMGGMTDDLVQLIEVSESNANESLEILKNIENRILKTANELLGSKLLKKFQEDTLRDILNIQKIIETNALIKKSSKENYDFVIGVGEIWTAQLINFYFQTMSENSTWIDARKIVTLRGDSVDFQKSKKLLDGKLNSSKANCYIITGFIAQNEKGVATTLGRNGSDYSASIFGNLLDVEAINIWTDVDGILSGNPKEVPEVEVLEELSYQEATELSYFGAEVIHLKTMIPALEKEIPLYIKNSSRPNHPGTKISKEVSKNAKSPIKGFSTVKNISLINLEGRGMIGVPGIAARLFNVMNSNQISVILISQASSEFSICFAVLSEQANKAKSCLESEFSNEIHNKFIEKVSIESGCSILAAVGDQMVGTVGVSAKFFAALGKANINIHAIAQGSSERNISVVIKEEESKKALRAVHSAFYLSKQTISVGIIGVGVVGGTLLKQLQEELNLLKESINLDLRIQVIANSKKMHALKDNSELDNWKELLATSAEKFNLENFTNYVNVEHIPHSLIIDCTSSENIASQYENWLKKGVHVITPNKKAATFPIEQYRKLKKEGKKMNSHFLYETTVGAGLPIIGTLKELVLTGDQVIHIEGVLSGTLAYIFYHYDGKLPFSEIVKEAKSKGFTEPDPRDDLSGMDIVRKVVILAREIGLDLEVDQIKVNSLVPKELETCSVSEFLDGLKNYDNDFKKKLTQAINEDKVLRYVGIIDPTGESRVELKAYDKTHPFSRIKATDNIVAFKTKRYFEQPLIIQGPGAGPEVTAAGVFADMIKLSKYLGSEF